MSTVFKSAVMCETFHTQRTETDRGILTASWTYCGFVSTKTEDFS